MYKACDFYIHNLDTSETKHVEFILITMIMIDVNFKGGVMIDNYYYALLYDYCYVVIDIHNPEPNFWKEIDAKFIINNNIAFTSSGNSLFYFGGTTVNKGNKYKTNTLLAHIFDNFNIKKREIYKNSEFPPSRLSSCLHSLRGELWLFGGKVKDALYDDILMF